MQRETRVFTLNRSELRAAGDAGEPRHFTGHAAVFNSLSEELWGFYERVGENAFERALAGDDDVRFLINHDPSLLLARTKNGTLALSKDDVGLVADADLPDTSYARDLAESMDRGDADQMSFGFRVIEDSWDWETLETEIGEVEILVRTLVKVELFDVSVVTFPAYTATDAELKNAAAYRYLGLAPLVGAGAAQPAPEQIDWRSVAAEHDELLNAFPVERRLASIVDAITGKSDVAVDAELAARALDALSEIAPNTSPADPAPAGEPDGTAAAAPGPPVSLSLRRRRLSLLERAHEPTTSR